MLELVGADLSGFALDDLVIDQLEQTPVEQLDPNNILDAMGLREIAERTARESIARSEVERDAERQRRLYEHDVQEMVIELERRKADALARFREATGRELSAEELQARLEDGLRRTVERVLEERGAAAKG